jgi:hypothetical protein
MLASIQISWPKSLAGEVGLLERRAGKRDVVAGAFAIAPDLQLIDLMSGPVQIGLSEPPKGIA